MTKTKLTYLFPEKKTHTKIAARDPIFKKISVRTKQLVYKRWAE